MSERPFLEFDEDFSERCASAFYEELFALIPGARDMFVDPVQQRQMFAVMLRTITSQADDQPVLRDTLINLGKMHREIGVQSLHLKIARAAFLGAVESAEPELTDEERSFFANSYDLIMAAMNQSSVEPVDA